MRDTRFAVQTAPERKDCQVARNARARPPGQGTRTLRISDAWYGFLKAVLKFASTETRISARLEIEASHARFRRLLNSESRVGPSDLLTRDSDLTRRAAHEMG